MRKGAFIKRNPSRVLYIKLPLLPIRFMSEIAYRKRKRRA